MLEESKSMLHRGTLPTVSRTGSAEPYDEEQRRLHETSRLILDAAGEGIYGLDLNGFVTFVNPAAREMTGWSIEDLEGRTQHSMVHHSHPDGSHYPREECPIYQALRDGQVHHREDEVFWRKDGTSFPVSYTSTPILRDGRPVGAVILFRDITERLKRQAWEKSKGAIFSSILAQEPLEYTAAALTAAFAAMYPEVCLAIHQRRNRSLHLLHQVAQSVLGCDLKRILIAEDACACGRAAFWGREQVWSCQSNDAATGFQYHECLPLLSASGEVLGTLSLFSTTQRPLHARLRADLMIAADFARLALEHYQMQQRLRHQAQHDLLTGLPNRLLLQDRLDQAIAAARRRGTSVGVCFIDLDRFKQINDTLGHGIGDEYLIRITSILRQTCREIDTLARQGGDEFILLLPDLQEAKEVQSVVARCLRAIQEPFAIDGNVFHATASIGISVYPDHGESPALLLQHADTALYAAKRDGRNRATLYHPDMGNEVQEHAWIYAGLQDALLRQEFRLVYQPLYSLQEQITGFEALLRWQHGTEGTITPDRFIPIAEESGLIVPIGQWVLREACRQAAHWQAEGAAPISMAVNVSGVQLGQPDFVQCVQTMLQETGFAPHLLHLEITETWIIADTRAAAARLRELQALGVKISIDDFGVGHSSFGCLHELPLNTLKIDRSFIARLDGSPRQLSTVRTIILLAQQLGLSTVAEGVETAAQLEELRSIDCDLLQGFLMARPLSADKARLLLYANAPLAAVLPAADPHEPAMPPIEASAR